MQEREVLRLLQHRYRMVSDIDDSRVDGFEGPHRYAEQASGLRCTYSTFDLVFRDPWNGRVLCKQVTRTGYGKRHCANGAIREFRSTDAFPFHLADCRPAARRCRDAVGQFVSRNCERAPLFSPVPIGK